MLDNIAMSEAQRNVARSNRLLGALESASRELIDPHLEPIKLKLGDIVCEAGGPLKHAYFPQGAGRCCRRFSSLSRAMPCIQRKRKCADGSS